MDIEGYEIAVIKGMRRTLETYGPDLLIEFHPHLTYPYRLAHTLTQLGNSGYNVRAVVDRHRDNPWRAWRVHYENMSLTQLKKDPRMTCWPQALTVFLGHS